MRMIWWGSTQITNSIKVMTIWWGFQTAQIVSSIESLQRVTFDYSIIILDSERIGGIVKTGKKWILFWVDDKWTLLFTMLAIHKLAAINSYKRSEEERLCVVLVRTTVRVRISHLTLLNVSLVEANPLLLLPFILFYLNVHLRNDRFILVLLNYYSFFLFFLHKS